MRLLAPRALFPSGGGEGGGGDFFFFSFLIKERIQGEKDGSCWSRKVETPPSLVGAARGLAARLRARRVSSLERVCGERLRGLANWFSKSQDLDRDLLAAVHDFARARATAS